jgi:hypothetical protein
MAEEYVYPRWYFSKEEPGGRIFETEADLEAAGGKGTWFLTPEAATAALPPPPTPPAPLGDEGSPTPRPTSRR